MFCENPQAKLVSEVLKTNIVGVLLGSRRFDDGIQFDG